MDQVSFSLTGTGRYRKQENYLERVEENIDPRQTEPKRISNFECRLLGALRTQLKWGLPFRLVPKGDINLYRAAEFKERYSAPDAHSRPDRTIQVTPGLDRARLGSIPPSQGAVPDCRSLDAFLQAFP